MGKAPGWTSAIAFAQGTLAPGWSGRDLTRSGEIPPAKAQLADTQSLSQKESLHQMKLCIAQG